MAESTSLSPSSRSAVSRRRHCARQREQSLSNRSWRCTRVRLTGSTLYSGVTITNRDWTRNTTAERLTRKALYDLVWSEPMMTLSGSGFPTSHSRRRARGQEYLLLSVDIGQKKMREGRNFRQRCHYVHTEWMMRSRSEPEAILRTII